MIDPRSFLEAVSAKSQSDNPIRTHVLGTIDENYVPGSYPLEKPRVDIPGQGLSLKGYTCLNTYSPFPGDRVLMAPVGSDYVILGAINVQETPRLEIGTVVWEAGHGDQTLNNNSSQYPFWEDIRRDLVGSARMRAQATRFHPTVPGWYSVGASVGFAPNPSGVRGVWLAQNSTTNTFNRVQVPGSAPGLTGLSTAPRLLYFNGTTDYAFVGAVQNSGGGLALSNTDNPGCFYAIYQGDQKLQEEAVAMMPLGYLPVQDPTEPPEPDPEPTLKRFTKDYYPTWSASWSTGYGKGSSSREAYQGRYDSAGGYNYTKWGFNGAAIRSDLSGATVVSVHWQMRNLHAYNNSGISVMLGTHNNSAEPGGSSSQSGNPNIYSYHQNKGATLNKSIPVSFGNALKNNTAQGIMIGHWSSGSQSTYGYFSRYGSNRPRLRIVYDKPV